MDDALHAAHLLAQGLKVGGVAGAVFCAVNGDIGAPADDAHRVAVADESGDRSAAYVAGAAGDEDSHRTSAR